MFAGQSTGGYAPRFDRVHLPRWRLLPMMVMSFRTRAAWAALLCLAPFASPDAARAGAQVNRLALTLAGVPTQVNATNFNENIDFYNRTVVTPPPRGYDPVAKVSFAWLFDSELRYFATRSLVIDAGDDSAVILRNLIAQAQAVHVCADQGIAPSLFLPVEAGCVEANFSSGRHRAGRASQPDRSASAVTLIQDKRGPPLEPDVFPY